MDALKENKVVVTLAGALVLALLVYFVFSGSAQGELANLEKKLTNRALKTFKNKVQGAPTDGEIASQEARRAALQREIASLHGKFVELDRGIELALPNRLTPDTGSTAFQQGLSGLAARLHQAYKDGFAHVPKKPRFAPEDPNELTADLDPFTPAITRDLKGEREFQALQQKRFWVMVDVTNAIRQACQTVTADGSVRPVCIIERVAFPAVSGATELTRPDATGLYVGIPFEFQLVTDIRVWPALRNALLAPQTPPSQKESDRNPVTLRRGIVYDRLLATMRVREIDPEISVSLDRDQKLRKLLNKRLGLPDDDREPFGAQDDAERQRITRDYVAKLKAEILQAYWKGPAPVTLTVTGDALDFTPEKVPAEPFGTPGTDDDDS